MPMMSMVCDDDGAGADTVDAFRGGGEWVGGGVVVGENFGGGGECMGGGGE